MPAVLVDSDVVGFADGNAGHVYAFPAGAPAAGDLDVLCVNSNTLVSTPSGFTLVTTEVGNQGSYIFFRIAAGSEGVSVTITTSGDHNTALTWSRWRNVVAPDQERSAIAQDGGGTTTPAVTTGALSESGELAIAFAALHNFTAAPSTPVWSTGYTALAEVAQDTGPDAVAQLVGYRTDAAGTQSPSVSWTNSVANRYMLVVTFTATATTASEGTLAATLPALTGQAEGAAAAAGTVAATLPALAGAMAADASTTGQLAGVLPTLAGAVTADASTGAQLAATLRTTSAPAAIFRTTAAPRLRMEVTDD